ncbi:MAG: Polysulfide reductase, NrfD, partial [Phycisphaerales bacterium]|nr:Polysulfide reductase, NrfD [Phycisphaerales bacterium]
GWHTTIFPPYFVAGAVYGGFAMVLNLAIPARKYFGLEDIITLRHIENCCKVMLATGMIVAYAYTLEFWTAWFGGNHFERFAFMNRAFGPYAWSFWVMVFCNVVAPQFLWVKKFRTNLLIVFIVATFANIGMWFERFEIIITSLTRDFLPSSWYAFKPTPIDLMMLAGSFGLFFTLFLLFCRFLPVVAMAEVKSVMPQAHAHGNGEHADHHKSDFQPDEHHRPGPGVEPSLTPA